VPTLLEAMLAKPMDFNRFGDELWEMANVFRDDALHEGSGTCCSRRRTARNNQCS
jgi:hypothetical protein